MEIITPRRPQPRAGCATLLFAGLVAVALAFFWMRDIHWFLLKRSARANFPSVDWISGDELEAALQHREKRTPLLLDVRTAQEWDVSRIPGAIRVEPGVPVETVVSGIAKDRDIVTYCAVGFRSAELANRLRAAGFDRVRNLDGSIFQWANESRPLVRGDKSVTEVHPYGSIWVHLLEKRARYSGR